MEKVIQGLFDHATRLFGITFSERVDIPKYHPETESMK
jgi:Zn-dependent oligopeptidase